MNDILRRKLGGARAARSAPRDLAFLGDLFARLLEERLRATLRGPVAVAVKPGGAAKLSEALEEAEPVALFGVAETPDGRLGAVTTVSGALVRLAVAAMTGDPRLDDGAKSKSAAPERAPTALDEALVARFAEDVIDCFERAMVPGPRFEDDGTLRFTHFVRRTGALSAPPEITDAIAFGIEISFAGAKDAHRVIFALPLGVFDLYRAAEQAAKAARPLFAHDTGAGELWSRAMLAAVNLAEIRLVGVLHETMMTIGALDALEPGAVIPLPDESRMRIALRIDAPGGVSSAADLASGALGAAGERRAVRMETPPDAALVEQLQPFAARA